VSFIRLENISKQYVLGDSVIDALKNVHLVINDGEFLSILGRSGSGKTTLLTIIGCMAMPTTGDYFFEEESVIQLSDDTLSDLRAEKIGFVFQNFHLLNEITAIENVMLPLYYRQEIPTQEIRDRALSALSEIGLADRIDHRPGELSGGQKQRVAIARALVTDPKIIIADEPTGAIDQSASDQILEIFQNLSSLGKTVMIVTHDEEVAGHTNRIIRLDDGAIVSDVDRLPSTQVGPPDFVEKPDVIHNVFSILEIRGMSESNPAALEEVFGSFNGSDTLRRRVLELLHSKGIVRDETGKNSSIVSQATQDRSAKVRFLAAGLVNALSESERATYFERVFSEETDVDTLIVSLREYSKKSPNSIEPVMKVMGHGSERVRASVLSAAASILKGSFKRDVVEDLLKWNKLIDKGLHDSDDRVVANTLELASDLNLMIPSLSLLKLFKKYLSSGHSRTLGNALIGLWKARAEDQEFLDAVQSLYESKDPISRLTCVYVLGEGFKLSVPPELALLSLRMLEDSNRNVVDSAKKMLSTVMGEEGEALPGQVALRKVLAARLNELLEELTSQERCA